MAWMKVLYKSAKEANKTVDRLKKKQTKKRSSKLSRCLECHKPIEVDIDDPIEYCEKCSPLQLSEENVDISE